jgi:2'-5' RNA ligase
MAKHFLFLELRDREICTLLHKLRFCFNEKPSKSNIHITVRGPYKNALKANDIKKYQQMMERDTIRVSGVGRFDHPESSVIFLRVESQHFENIWWKPDFPKQTYGFNPHISLYSGNDKVLADRVFNFLKLESLCLETRQFELTPYVSNQFCLISAAHRESEKHFLHLILNGKVKGDIIDRAQALVELHHRTTRIDVG